MNQRTVTGTTGSIGFVAGQGGDTTVYKASGSISIGLGCKNVQISQAALVPAVNTVSYNSSTGIASYAIYSTRANALVSATITWEL